MTDWEVKADNWNLNNYNATNWNMKRCLGNKSLEVCTLNAGVQRCLCLFLFLIPLMFPASDLAGMTRLTMAKGPMALPIIKWQNCDELGLWSSPVEDEDSLVCQELAVDKDWLGTSV